VVIIKLSLKLLIFLIVFIGIFIFLKPFYTKDSVNSHYVYSSYEDSILIKDNVDDITSDASESNTDLISLENKNKPSSSKEFRQLLQNAKKCMKSKFQIIKIIK